MIVLKIMKVDVDFKYLFKISAYIITIPTILTIINVVILNFLMPLMSELNLIVIVGYFILIGKGLKKNKSLNTEDNNDKIS
jgi:heme/copper-type cytochrome/quinol oxidase subunit 1